MLRPVNDVMTIVMFSAGTPSSPSQDLDVSKQQEARRHTSECERVNDVMTIVMFFVGTPFCPSKGLDVHKQHGARRIQLSERQKEQTRGQEINRLHGESVYPTC